MPTRMIFVDHLPSSFGENQLLEVLSSYGTVTSIRLPRDKHDKPRGFAFARMASEEEARLAVDAIDSAALSVDALHAQLATGRRHLDH